MKLTCRIKSILFVALFFIAFSGTVSAATLSLTKIGALSTGGAAYSEWWYSETNPVLAGTAAADAVVNIKIDDNSYKATADASGNWTYATTLAKSDPVITISSGTDTYTFTLHVGQVMSEGTPTQPTTKTSETSPSAVPQTGFPQVAGIILGLSMVMLGVYSYSKNKREDYAKSVIESLD